MSTIPLRNGDGCVALVDDADYETVAAHEWRMTRGTGTHYAVATTGPYLSMHQLIAQAPPGQMVHHWNGDGLDNRRSNHHVCTSAEHNRLPHGVPEWAWPTTYGPYVRPEVPGPPCREGYGWLRFWQEHARHVRGPAPGYKRKAKAHE